MNINTIKTHLLDELNKERANRYKETWVGKDGEKFQVAKTDTNVPSNGFYIYRENDKYVCDIKWWSNAKQNENIGLKEYCYKSSVNALVMVCRVAKGWDSEPVIKKDDSSIQKGMRVKIAEIPVDGNENEFVNKISVWEKLHMQEFDDIQQRILDGQDNAESVGQRLIREIQMKKYIDLLLNNHNIILHGAPGTGKTYLAKEIAKAKGFDCTDNEIGFVQFHQSYDYTDFVEGLRPKDDGDDSIGFEPKDGIFKKFCVKALKNLVDSKKTLEERKLDYNFETKYNKLIDSIENGEINEVELKTNKKMDIVKVSEQNTIVLKTKNSSSKRVYHVSFNRLGQLAKIYPDKKSLQNLSNSDIRNAIKGCHASSYWAVLNALYGQQQDEVQTPLEQIQEKKYVFIIDEINRGEMSKIFGELFYSIDPGYRVKYKDLIDHKENKDRLTTIQTQYANLQKVANAFDNELGITDDDKDNHGHFFVPENVYIIGTMNDIDRSVDSMDFAMRRRFAFKEITAESRKGMLEQLGDKQNIAEKVMVALNKEIEKVPGLSSAYHIGPAYFLKLKIYEGDFTKLWQNHIAGVVKEYLRGMPKADELFKTLEKVYNDAVASTPKKLDTETATPAERADEDPGEGGKA